MTDDGETGQESPPTGAAEAGPGLFPAAPAAEPYRVLARKYRPATFEDLIGQDAMVRTLTNAFAAGRIAQAYMLTGVRGVGKTTTARILARALNYEPKDTPPTGPTVAMPEPGVHCTAIMESRHPDVVEMDAASHTGIDDVREIIESVRYRPMSARYKVYIIDEVHMLSRQAFNGLLKTLEEPPEHARFIFATTEVRKVPVTVLSRCQRFDLRRIPADLLIAHFRSIAAREGAEIADEALALIARAAEGSARDGLSLLDQAIAHGGGTIEAETVRRMLGLADRGRVIDLFEAVMAGRTANALAELRAEYDAGADPLVVLSDMAEFVHLVTRVKVTESSLDDPALTEVERERAGALAAGLGMAALARAWQMLLKGLGEVQEAPRPLAAADMVLVRMAYAADLPPPGEVVRRLTDTASRTPPAPSPSPSPNSPPSASPAGAATRPLSAGPSAAEEAGRAAGGSSPRTGNGENADGDLPMPGSFAEAAALVGDFDIRLAHLVETSVTPVRFSPGRIEITIAAEAPRDLAGRFRQTLERATGQSWAVSVASGGGGRTLREEREAAEASRLAEAAGHPVVKAVIDAFPGAEIVAVREPDGPCEPQASVPDEVSREA